MTDKRIDFDSKVKAAIGRRTNFQCSVPRCTKPALGPALDSAIDFVNMGTACHIYSAKKNGPRGWGGKSEEWIGSVENGIWCCNYHGTRIDKRKGSEFPPDELLAWKALAEARVIKQMNDLPSPLGWVELIEMDNCRLFKSMPKIKPSRFTLVCGEEGSGKSLLFEMAASISNSQYGERLIDLGKSSHMKGTVTYSTVDHHEIKLRLDFFDSNLHRHHNNMLLNMPPSDIEVIYYPSQIRDRFTEEDDLQFLMRILVVDKSALKTMCSDLGSNTLVKGEFYFEQSKSQDEDNGTETLDLNEDSTPLLKLICKLDGRDFSTTFNGLSRSEQLRIIMSFFIIKARELSKQKLTLLILETDSINFDENNFKKLLNVLLEQPFQVVLNVPNARYTNVIDVDELGNPSLKSHDYLERWSLAKIESEKIRSNQIRGIIT